MTTEKTTEKTSEEYAAENRAVQRRLARSMIIEEIILAMVRGGTTMEERAIDVYDGRRAWTKTYTARTKRAVNSGGTL